MLSGQNLPSAPFWLVNFRDGRPKLRWVEVSQKPDVERSIFHWPTYGHQRCVFQQQGCIRKQKFKAK